jgi:hypothetical protein
VLALDRHIDAEVLDARGGLAVTTNGTRLNGTLRDVPQLFVEGAQLAIALDVPSDQGGRDRYEALCRVLDTAVVVTPGSHINLEVLKARPSDMSSLPFDMIPLSLDGGALGDAPPPPVVASLPPQDAFGEDDADEPTGVVGTLKAMPVVEIVQGLAQGAKDALVEVRPKGSAGGTIIVERGRIIYAATDKNEAEAAFFELMAASRGAFRIRYGKHDAPTRNINRDTTFLILEGARLLDESRVPETPPSGVLQPDFMAHDVGGAGVLEIEDAGVTTVDELPVITSPPPLPVLAPPRMAAPASLLHAGPFSRFFDEAGVKTPPPLPTETRRFTSLKLPDIAGELDDDLDGVDSSRTRRERR